MCMYNAGFIVIVLGLRCMVGFTRCWLACMHAVQREGVEPRLDICYLHSKAYACSVGGSPIASVLRGPRVGSQQWESEEHGATRRVGILRIASNSVLAPPGV